MSLPAVRHDSRKLFPLFAILMWSLGLAACAAAVPVTGPVAGDVAGVAVDKTNDIVRNGKAQTHQPVGIDDMIAITRQAAGELDLRQIDQKKHPDQIKLIYQDQRKQDITVTLIRRTNKATEIRVDVGLLGDSGMGQLFLRQIMRDMPQPAREAAATSEKNIPSLTSEKKSDQSVMPNEGEHSGGDSANADGPK